MYNKLVTIIFVGALIGGCQKDAEVIEKDSQLGVFDDLAAVYHGLPLDKQGDIVDIDANGILESFDATISKFSESLSNEDTESLHQLSKSLAEEDLLSDQLALILKGVEVQLIVDANKDLKSRTLDLSVQYLRELSKTFPVEDGQRFNKESIIQLPLYAQQRNIRLKPEIFDIIRDWTTWFPIDLPYCVLNGVPQPPDWGAAGWVRKTAGAVTTVPFNRLYIFKDAGYTTEVWTATDPAGRGGCIALPRKRGTETTLGVICQNKDTGNACFWDNRPHAGGSTYSDTQMSGLKKSIVRDWVNGKDTALIGGGKCVNCHRGNNAFVLHQDTLISNNPPMPFNTNSAVWYTMINSLGWINPPKTVLPGNGGCVTCHDIGSTTDRERGNYCALLKLAANQEMPSVTSPATWTPAAGTIEKTHIDIMKNNQCPP